MTTAADRLIEELEQHMRRIIEHPKPNTLNITDMRGALARELERFVDSRIQKRIEQLEQQSGKVPG